MTTLDWVTIALYFGLLAGLTWWSVAKNRETADDHFLAGRNIGRLVVGASIFASRDEWRCAGTLRAPCMCLRWVRVPFYLRSRVYTMPEFLELRFSATARWGLIAISFGRVCTDEDGRRHLPGRAGLIRLPAGDSGVSGSADRNRVLLRGVSPHC